MMTATGLLIVDAIDDGVGGEAAEDDRVHGADAGAGEHGDGQLRAPCPCRSQRGLPGLTPSDFEHIGERSLRRATVRRSACGFRRARPPR